MRYKVVTIRDRVADLFGQPSFVNSIGAAIRSFGDEIKRPPNEARPNPLYDHPEDFDFYQLGEYDDETGTFINEDRPKQIAIGKDYIG